MSLSFKTISRMIIYVDRAVKLKCTVTKTPPEQIFLCPSWAIHSFGQVLVIVCGKRAR